MNARYTPALALTAVLSLVGWMAADVPLSFATGGTVTIEGTSNVHGWTCAAERFTGTGDGTPTASGLTALSALTVTVPVAQIDCGNRTMNGKLRDALLATTAPTVRFVLSNATVSNRTMTANGQLTIAGQTRPVRITAQGQPVSGNRFRFTGTVPLLMSQYGIRPPTAMMGTMRTRDAVTIRFDVTLTR
ncbi:MAG TPA: YceI family protein [Rubricoccaceae bacterium]|jgi:polyisoprenoid-binding protein YceI